MKYLNVALFAIALISSTAAAPATFSKDRCGPKFGKCDKGYCCSQYNWCGTSNDHCGKGCQSEFGICGTSSSNPSKPSKPSNPSIPVDSSSIKWENQYGKIDKEARPYAKAIWNFLVKKIGNKNGAAGMIGNLYAESRLQPADLEKKYEKQFKMNDQEYTKAVDKGTYKKFTTDKGGYGLVQWTSKNRKTKLLEYAKKRGTSIGDLQMQLDFLWIELQDYQSLIKTLKNASSVQKASDAVMLIYEQPQDQSQKKLNERANYGKMLKLALDH
ncbi:carbohydrate-binding module family 18 protein [Piromyces sp. E2]|nr:carbohydrate-binding module family 18 protein [Piromyces sp. E2]|eukprot:OUM56466.1 carbohydrate-binding module family 18 protein [Piromyces sp. E2]